MMEQDQMKSVIKTFILENFLEGSSADELTDSTPLVTGGILDSVSTLKFVSFIEEQFGVEFAPQDIDQDNLNTIPLIVDFINSKLQGG
jgi:acyl carrier protein